MSSVHSSSGMHMAELGMNLETFTYIRLHGSLVGGSTAVQERERESSNIDHL